ncbi:hypothetical protein D3C75_1066830 [compost metagenome]
MLLATRFQRFLKRALHKMHGFAESYLRQVKHIGFDYAGDSRIAAGCLSIVHQYNRLPVVRHLNHTG